MLLGIKKKSDTEAGKKWEGEIIPQDLDFSSTVRLKIFSPDSLTIILLFVRESVPIRGLKNSHANIYCAIATCN